MHAFSGFRQRSWEGMGGARNTPRYSSSHRLGGSDGEHQEVKSFLFFIFWASRMKIERGRRVVGRKEMCRARVAEAPTYHDRAGAGVVRGRKKRGLL